MEAAIGVTRPIDYSGRGTGGGWMRLLCVLASLKRRDGTSFKVPSPGSAICAAMIYLRGSFSGQTIKPAWLPADHSSRSKVARMICASRVSCHRTAEARCTAS